MNDETSEFPEELAQLVYAHIEDETDLETIADALATQLDRVRSRLPPPDDEIVLTHESEPVDERKTGRISGWDRR